MLAAACFKMNVIVAENGAKVENNKSCVCECHFKKNNRYTVKCDETIIAMKRSKVENWMRTEKNDK